jgi:threonine/homoserine/homoserine lactone efflux protein
VTFSALLAFWGLAVLLIAVPGPDWAFTLGATLHGQPVRAAVGGLVAGYAVLTAVVAAGVGAVVAGSAAALTTLTLAGGAYLTWQGLSTLRHPATPAADSPPTRTGWGTVLRGMGVSGLNPKALLLFLALLPQFAAPQGGWPLTAQLALLGGVFTVSCAAFYAALGSLAHSVMAARPAAARMLSRLSGAGMLLAGLLLVAERVRP